MDAINNFSLMDKMVIDCDQVTQVIVNYIRKKVAEAKCEGVLIGLSGGVDSTVLAFILAKAMDDPSKVHSLHLYDRDSQKKFRKYAENVANMLGINFEEIEITSTLKEQGIYKPLIMRIVPYSTLVNKLILISNKIASPLLYGESPFVVTLKRMNPKEMNLGFVANIAKTIEEGFNARHILRRKILENYAKEKSLLLVGAANRSESFVGWFVKDGVDDLPIEILLGLYKNQVRQLGRYLGVPDYILNEAPSPDMFKGIGDEECFGHKYEIVDKVAYVHEQGLDADVAQKDGVSRKEYFQIMKLHDLSSWKRESEHDYPVIP